ncbi:hypothetical protein KSP40_PGU010710 [Platanthera guangdongensis]|uniref:Uncharacterized protein n=1 Tax=Platanthera guangdongensis TaxID=2320717 RepID=A0ABR2MGN6_9ASPA
MHVEINEEGREGMRWPAMHEKGSSCKGGWMHGLGFGLEEELGLHVSLKWAAFLK